MRKKPEQCLGDHKESVQTDANREGRVKILRCVAMSQAVTVMMVMLVIIMRMLVIIMRMLAIMLMILVRMAVMVMGLVGVHNTYLFNKNNPASDNATPTKRGYEAGSRKTQSLQLPLTPRPRQVPSAPLSVQECLLILPPTHP